MKLFSDEFDRVKSTATLKLVRSVSTAVSKLEAGKGKSFSKSSNVFGNSVKIMPIIYCTVERLSRIDETIQ